MKLNEPIQIRGAREHNLQDIDVTIPRAQLVVVTGPSGSGKSSLAFDTVYAEGQRRYVESLSAYARQFIGQNQKPDVDGIEGLSPAIAIEQKSTSRNPRSTVGTLTEIYDYLRLLFARVGIPYCPVTGLPIERQTVQEIVDQILENPERTKLMILAPVVQGRKGEYKRELNLYRKEGFVRIRVDGEIRLLEEEIVLEKQNKHTLELVVDRLVVKDGIRQRLTDSVEQALRLADGTVRAVIVGGEERLYSERFESTESGLSFSELTPRMFSFNSPFGACPECEGLGLAGKLDIEKVIPDQSLSLVEGVIHPWARSAAGGTYRQQLICVCKAYKVDPETAWEKLPKRIQKVVLEGSGKKELQFHYKGDGSDYRYKRPFEGVLPSLMRRYKETDSESVREQIQGYMSHQPCLSCAGARLKPEALAVRVGEHNIDAVCRWPIGEAHLYFEKLKFKGSKAKISKEILKEIRSRLSFLDGVGLGYLNLARTSATLSGGEAQRIRLATQIGSALRGVIYVLDEPSIGLHQRDNGRLLKTLENLRDLGNTVLVVEHDEETIRRADHIIDMGPGAGLLGGHIVAQGPIKTILKSKKSETAAYLSGRKKIGIEKTKRQANGKSLSIYEAVGNNLQCVDAHFPLGHLICVTGVSGSGKSSLISGTLQKAISKQLHGGSQAPLPYGRIEGAEHLDKIIVIDQSPIGRTPRSNPATYTQLFGTIRELYAGVPESRARGYKPGRFSFNVKGGRCEACEGDGVRRIEMHFLPDVFVTCETCVGRRYNRETLEILFKGKSVADALEMTVSEAVDFFQNVPTIHRRLLTLEAVGLGYMHLGQSATTLSGGEAQRIKLSRELSKRPTGKTLYVLDEPTTGLHFCDVDKLLEVLQKLVEPGNTMIVIEHNLDVIRCADHIIDLGPEGGQGGGTIVATGTPQELAENESSHTGRYLKSYFDKS
ncbi:MAG: excinuclease ABC subunit UvrA [Deltaproteobacteria bacterium]|nr:excinuclease ABC subunit UvrA [Deltaproteobacteria bacterium]MBT6489980.1 excinuclease ABC subunit UvrA [Deltaproteobacteria bacterium]